MKLLNFENWSNSKLRAKKKLDINIENKVIQKSMLSKNVNYKKCASMQKKRDSDDF